LVSSLVKRVGTEEPCEGIVHAGFCGGAAGNCCLYPATRIAIARFYNGYLPAKKWVIMASLASPQSRDFKRWAEPEGTQNAL